MPGDAPLTTLRGAGVAAVDVRRLGRAFGWLGVAALVATAAVLFAAGVHKNSQITTLRTRGEPVTVTVTRCLGQLGGSGSNPVGFDCTGTYVVSGRRYSQHIPDGAYHEPGSKVRGVAVPGDPTLLSTPGIVAGEHASAAVYVVPSVLVILAIAGAGALELGRRRRLKSGAVS